MRFEDRKKTGEPGRNGETGKERKRTPENARFRQEFLLKWGNPRYEIPIFGRHC
jgi:hypothetical protein